MDTVKTNFDAQIRFKVPPELRARLERIAMKRCKLISEVSREAVVRFVESEEAKDASNGNGHAANGEEAA